MEIISGASEKVYYGPETFRIASANVPVVRRRMITNPDFIYLENFVLGVQNGDGNLSRVSTLEVKIDGVVIVTTADFNLGSNIVTKPLTGLKATAKMEIKMSGPFNSFIIVGIKGTLKGSAITDVEGNLYNTVQIGTQTWMAENLKTTRYNDGVHITLVQDNEDWLDLASMNGMPPSAYYIGGYCWYNNQISNKNIYGALYNWPSIHMNKLAPVGWHIPSLADWRILSSYLGGSVIAGGKLKEAGTAHWLTPNAGATNASGFTALPGGIRRSNGNFEYIGELCYFWSPSGAGAFLADHYFMGYSDAMFRCYKTHMSSGLSVRCVKD